MKFFKLILVTTSIFLSMKSHSQQSQLTLEDLMPGGKTYNKYRAEMPQQMVWLGDKLTYIKGDTIYIAPVTTKGSPAILTTLNDINSELKKESKDTDITLYSLRYLEISNPQSDEVLLTTSTGTYLYSLTTKKITGRFLSVKHEKNKDYTSAGKAFAFTVDNNLYVETKEGKKLTVTSDDDKNIVNGQSVHRSEFGIEKGTFWSPQGNLLAFYRMDESMVTDYPLVDISARVAKLESIKYPMAGMKSHHVTVGVYNPTTEKTIFLKTGTPKEKYLTNIAWSPDEKSIYIAEINRGQDTCVVKRYDVSTGKEDAVLFTETHPKYVEPQTPVRFLKNDPTKFIWESLRDGHNHLYLYDTSGKLLKQLTTGTWDVTSVLGFDEKGENLFYTSTEVSPIERHLYKLNLKTGNKTQLSTEQGVHRGKLSASGRYIVDTYTSQYNAGKVAITDTKSNKGYIFHTAKDPYRNITLPEITLGTLKANDGQTDLYYRLVKPSNFDPNKKYPVVVYVYGGPHSQLVDNSWMGQARGWDIYMAQKGYVVFTLDNRGTTYRGADFENITHRQLGIIETQDQMTGVDYLKSLPYVDANRMGVHGWSYGGFMTLNMMLRHSDVFKVGVAGGPVTNWSYYEIMYGERYMDSPKENPEGYKETDMVARAGDLKGRLLLIHGDEDPTVVMQHNLAFIKSAVKNGTHPDLFIYPGHGHNVMGHDRVHLYEHITRYFDDFLK